MSFEILRSDISALALGSAVLGCGGGGNSYYGQLVASRALAADSSVRVIDIEEMDARAFALTSAAVGAPLICLEKPPSMSALRVGVDSAKALLHGSVGAFFAAEIGGLQCMFPLMLAAETGLPLLDGDGMGRAFPELQMSTFAIYGTTPGLPTVLSSDRGLLFDNVSAMLKYAPPPADSRDSGDVRFERAVRKICADDGGLIYLTAAFDQPSLSRTIVRGSIHLALKIGRAVESARSANTDPIAALIDAGCGKRFIGGKIVDVERHFRGGHDWGEVRLEGIDDSRARSSSRDRGRVARISFKNEYLILWLDGEVVLTVPDLITLAETETGTPVSTEILRPGLRVTVVGLPCSPLLRSPAALRAVGPRAFGYDLEYVSIDRID
ncbi:MAG: DUF917 domain-containing protein [Candidatus Binatus sp.]|uniref:DUF917 domain-containing protein n=1 Tax=Candidatus Binatus sp. TaxID=2811406 RepID=UPI0027273897|nr:DUF917 domain-containing protein [Candidatus Binatus sp.]MDO8431637.1 DUF917 domain-containing protein [Candidatus Binatus sp.]